METTSNQNNNAMLIHLSALSSYFIPFGNLLLPIILWQSMKKDNEYVDFHGKEAVNFNLSFFLYFIVLVILAGIGLITTIVKATQMDQGATESSDIVQLLFSTSGFLLPIIILGVFSLVKLIMVIVAGIKAGQGERYRYPLSIRFIK